MDQSTTIWVVSILEAIYIVYMYNYFETEIEFHHPLEMLVVCASDWLKHPIGTGLKECKICPLGNFASILIAIMILARAVALTSGVETKFYSGLAVILVFTCSLLTNMNAWIYLIPVFLLEWYFFQQKAFSSLPSL